MKRSCRYRPSACARPETSLGYAEFEVLGVGCPMRDVEVRLGKSRTTRPPTQAAKEKGPGEVGAGAFCSRAVNQGVLSARLPYNLWERARQIFGRIPPEQSSQQRSCKRGRNSESGQYESTNKMSA